MPHSTELLSRMAPAGVHPTFADIVGVLQELQAQVASLHDQNGPSGPGYKPRQCLLSPQLLHPFSVSPSCPYPVSWRGIVPNVMGSLTNVVSSSCCGQLDLTAQFQVGLVLSLLRGEALTGVSPFLEGSSPLLEHCGSFVRAGVGVSMDPNGEWTAEAALHALWQRVGSVAAEFQCLATDTHWNEAVP